MKIALFNDYVPGLVRGDEIIDVGGVLPKSIMDAPPVYRMNLLIERFADVRSDLEKALTRPGRSLSSVRLRAPSPMPSQMLFAMGNYHEGLVGTSRPLGLFLKAPSSILDPGGTVVLPRNDAKIFHHEGELAVVISRHCRSISAPEALEYVFGYSGVIDVSARGLGPGVGFAEKSFETFCPMGPWITLQDEIPDPQNLAIRYWENDQMRQDYHTREMEHTVAALLSFASHVTALRPGDVVACGTNHQGLGPMQDAETATLEVERVGKLTVSVRDELKRRWPMQIDPNIGVAIREWRTSGTPLDPEKAFMRRIA
jgi:2-keto-4-pentenoate hydratase/2-oxohepta-3-ene-1,7-dioic acid hydratase in catechol pathway